MRSYSAPFVDNGFHMPVKGDDFAYDFDLFHEFPGDRSSHRLADFGDAAGAG